MQSPSRHPARFAATRWSLVAASARDDADGRRALGELCELYWYPLYAFARRQGFAREAAEDLVQDFLRALIERGDLGGVDAARGRFRAFLLAALRNFLANERDRARAQKRGGGAAPIAIDAADGERRYVAEPAVAVTPEQQFERSFALALLERCTQELGDEWRQAGRGAEFDRLETLLTPGGDASYRAVGAELTMSETAVKMAVHRLRRRMALLLRGAIRDVVQCEEDVDDEIRQLFLALAAPATPIPPPAPPRNPADSR